MPELLLQAANNGDEAKVRELIEIGTPVELTDFNDTRTALYFACAQNHERIARYLITQAAQVHIKDQNGWTPLHVAAEKGYLAIVKMLVENGADLNSETSEEEKAYDIARGKNQTHVTNYLASISFRAEKSLIENCANGNFSTVQDLIERQNVRVNCVDEAGESPLSAALWYKHYNISNYLISKRANIFQKNKNGNTPYIQAGARGDKDAMNLLINSISNLKLRHTYANISGNYNRTALEWAQANGFFETAKYLLTLPYIDSVHFSGNFVSIKEYVTLSLNVNDSDIQLPTGWKKITSDFPYHFTQDVFPRAPEIFAWDNFPIALYVNQFKKTAVLTFCGTQPKISDTFLADFFLLLQKSPIICYQYFNTLMQKVRAATPYEVHVTGHSLGGSLATIFAALFGLRATIFDGTGTKTSLKDLDIPYDRTRHIHSYLSAPNPINTLQEHVGRVYWVKLNANDEKFNPKLSMLLTRSQGAADSHWKPLYDTYKYLFQPTLSFFLNTDANPQLSLDWGEIVCNWFQQFGWLSEQHSLKNWLAEDMRLFDSIGNFNREFCLPMNKWPNRAALFSESFFSAVKNSESDDRYYNVVSNLPGLEPK